MATNDRLDSSLKGKDPPNDHGWLATAAPHPLAKIAAETI
jgi:hypothetical protein